MLAVKLRWPAAVDGTAMVMGSMAPDWAYALHGTPLAFGAHAGWGLLLFCAPAAVLAALGLRRAAPVLFSYFPSPPALPLRQLAVLGSRRPRLPVSLASAFAGALSHVVWDLFTHDGEWGPRHVAWLRSTVVDVAGHAPTWAGMLQYASHVGGALVSLYLLHRILTSESLLRWYGDEPLPAPPRGGQWRFWTITAAGSVAGVVAAALGQPGFPGRIIRVSLGMAAGLVAASVACAREPGAARAPRGATQSQL